MINWVKVLTAIATIESGGDPGAVGDGGRALGPLQIHVGVLKDVNRIYGTKWTHRDAKDPKKARAIAKRYLTYWGRAYQKKTGLPATPVVLARIWNGGPNGWYKRSTQNYGDRFGRIYDGQ